jgi:hypothetical protein
MQISTGVSNIPGGPVQVPAINPGVNGNLAAERRKLVGAIAAINQAGALGPQRQMSFLVDPASRRLIVRIIDTGSHEVISQIPSEGVLAMESQLAKLGSGSSSSAPLPRGAKPTA